MTPAAALQVRQITEAEYETRKAVGRGLLFDGESSSRMFGNPFDETQPPVSLTLTCDRSDDDWHAANDVIAFASRHGVCRMTNGHVVLGLLAGVPPPPEHDPRLGALFENLCLSRLSRSIFVNAAPLQSATADARSTSQDIELTFEAARADLSGLSRARAPLAFWQALTLQGVRSPSAVPSHRRQWMLELPVVIATGRFPVSVVASLAVDDVLQFKSVSMQPDGSGDMQIGTRRVSFDFEHDADRMVMTIKGVFARGRPQRHINLLTETQSMNEADEFDVFDDDDDDDFDEPAAGDHPTHEEADADTKAMQARDTADGERAPIDVRSIDIQIVVEVGRLTVSIGDLEDLQIGSILKVATPGVRTVAIKTSASADAGQTIALGELVQVNDSLAVQITRVFE